MILYLIMKKKKKAKLEQCLLRVILRPRPTKDGMLFNTALQGN